MKKIFTLSAVIIFISTTLFSQITITLADLPQAGNTYITATDTTPSINNGVPSASSQVWDFSSLTMDYPSVPTYGLTSWTPYASAFPASNIYTYGPSAMYSSLSGGAPVSSQGMNKGYMFWKTDINGFWIIGFRADSGSYANTNVTDAPSELLIGTPATYGTPFSNNSRWVFPMNLIPTDVDTYYVSTTVKTLTSDAWGSLTTPTGVFPNVLRIHEHLVKVDSVYAQIGTTVILSQEFSRDTLNNYLYMANGIGYPLSIVHADVNDLIYSVEYYTGTFMGVNEINNNAALNLYPNPCSDNLEVSYSGKGNIAIEIIDVTGRIVLSKEVVHAENQKIFCDVSSIDKGIYILKIMNDRGEVVSQKFVKN
ncbi:hypothetical protein BH09BAC5_BH09BAC5_23540 [soil metagenome]